MFLTLCSIHLKLWTRPPSKVYVYLIIFKPGCRRTELLKIYSKSVDSWQWCNLYVVSHRFPDHERADNRFGPLSTAPHPRKLQVIIIIMHLVVFRCEAFYWLVNPTLSIQILHSNGSKHSFWGVFHHQIVCGLCSCSSGLDSNTAFVHSFTSRQYPRSCTGIMVYGYGAVCFSLRLRS